RVPADVRVERVRPRGDHAVVAAGVRGEPAHHRDGERGPHAHAGPGGGGAAGPLRRVLRGEVARVVRGDRGGLRTARPRAGPPPLTPVEATGGPGNPPGPPVPCLRVPAAIARR